MDGDTHHAYGFDPAFRHGALVYTNFSIGSRREKDRLTDLKIIYSWGQKNGVSPKASPTELFRLAQNIVDPLKSIPVLPIAIDWDPQSVYWRASRIQIVQLGLFLGYLTRAMHDLGFPVVYINPGQVRKAFGSNNARMKKEEIHQWFREFCTYEEYENFLNQKNTDYLDATILAYLLARSIPSEGQYSWQFLTSPV